MIIFENFSDDAGSDSSADDGLPKHLEVIAAAKVNIELYLKLYIKDCLYLRFD